MARQDIQIRANAIGIKQLLHFTRAVNLPSIMQYGLYPVGRTAEIGVTPQINDELRLDRRRDGTSLSISLPNSPMFYKYRQQSKGVEWVVLGVRPSVLWLKDCAFCCHNAASARISRQPIEQLKTPAAFDGMFEEIEGVDSRQSQRLNSFDTTDVQAEVMVFDVIEPSFIVGAAFDSATTQEHYKGSLVGRKSLLYDVNKGFFASRSFLR